MTASPWARPWIIRATCLIALVWCGIVLLLHWAFSAFACAWDTSNCALSRDKNGVYQGVLVDLQGRPIRNADFTVSFESRRSAHPRRVSGYSTDAQGRYCLIWSQERIIPFAYYNGSGTSIRGSWQPLDGASPPARCQAGDQGIPWRRADDLRSSVQFVAVPALVIPGSVLLLAGLLLGGAPSAARVRTCGFVLTAAGTVLAVLVWYV